MMPPPGADPTSQYQIKRGDNLTKIASRQLPKGATPQQVQAMIDQIAKTNNISDPNRIQAGANLKMPPGMSNDAVAPPAPPPVDSALQGAGSLPPLPPPGTPADVPQPGLMSPGLSVSQPQMDQLMAPPAAGMPAGDVMPQSIPVPMPQTAGAMPPDVSITPPTESEVKVTRGKKKKKKK